MSTVCSIQEVATTLSDTSKPGPVDKAKVSILQNAAVEMSKASIYNDALPPRKCKRLPRDLSSRVKAEKNRYLIFKFVVVVRS